MDRNLHKKYTPQCPRQAGIVDQYLWNIKDTNYYRCYNGISHPIYDCQGHVNFTLPLEMWPKVDKIHPQIRMTKRPILNERPVAYMSGRFANLSRGRNQTENFAMMDKKSNRIEGFYL